MDAAQRSAARCDHTSAVGVAMPGTPPILDSIAKVGEAAGLANPNGLISGSGSDPPTFDTFRIINPGGTLPLPLPPPLPPVVGVTLIICRPTDRHNQKIQIITTEISLCHSDTLQQMSAAQHSPCVLSALHRCSMHAGVSSSADAHQHLKPQFCFGASTGSKNHR